MKVVNEKEFEELIVKDSLTVIDFSASWCMPCRMLKPIMEKVEQAFPNVIFANVDISEDEELSEKYKIFSVPTILAFKKGEIVNSFVGLKTFDEIVNFVYDSIEK